MPFDQNRHDKIFAAAQAVRHDYSALLARLEDSLKRADHVILIGHWIDDVEIPILRAARRAQDDLTAAKWLSLAEVALQQIEMMLEAVKADIDPTGRSGTAGFGE